MDFGTLAGREPGEGIGVEEGMDGWMNVGLWKGKDLRVGQRA